METKEIYTREEVIEVLNFAVHNYHTQGINDPWGRHGFSPYTGHSSTKVLEHFDREKESGLEEKTTE